MTIDITNNHTNCCICHLFYSLHFDSGLKFHSKVEFNLLVSTCCTVATIGLQLEPTQEEKTSQEAKRVKLYHHQAEVYHVMVTTKLLRF